MKGKILFATGLAVGYVLGTKAGRERYEQIAAQASKLWNDPKVKEQVSHVEDFVKDKGPEVVDFVTDNAKTVASKVTGRKKSSGSSSSSGAARTSGTTPSGVSS